MRLPAATPPTVIDASLPCSPAGSNTTPQHVDDCAGQGAEAAGKCRFLPFRPDLRPADVALEPKVLLSGLRDFSLTIF